MTDVKNWSETPGSNDQVSPDGFPELMARSGVNDSARELMASIRADYGDPTWLNLYSETGVAWEAVRGTDTQVSLQPLNSQDIDIRTRFKVGSRIKIEQTVDDDLFGFLTTLGYGSTYTVLTVEFDDVADVVPADITDILIGINQDSLGKTAYYPTGSTLAQLPPQVPTADDLGDAAWEDQGAGNGLNADTVDGQHAAQIVASAASTTDRNALYNGAFMVWQRGTTITDSVVDGRTHVNSNGEYCADRWMLLSGNSTSSKDDMVDVDRSVAAPPAGFWANLKLTRTATSIVTNDKAGILQILEGKESAQFVGSTAVSISVDLKSTSNITGARVLVLGWTGNEDEPTSDPIDDWASAGGDIIYQAGWVEMIDSGVIVTDNNWTRNENEDNDISAFDTVKNIAVMIYIDDADWGIAETLEISGVQIENSVAATPYAHRDYDTELRRCQRYFNHTFDEGVSPRDAVGEFTGMNWFTGNSASGGVDGTTMTYSYPTTMRAAPAAIKVFNPLNSTVDTFYDDKDDGDVDQSEFTETITQKRVNWSYTGQTYDQRIMRAHVEADAEF